MQDQEKMVQTMQVMNNLTEWKPDAVLLDKEGDKYLVNLLTKQLEWCILEDERDLIIFAPGAE